MPGSTMSFLGGLLVLAILLIILLIFQKYFKLAEVRKMVSPSERQQASASAKFSSVNLRTISYFDFQTLNKATKNFHPTNLLGKGGFGPVYLGKLEDGRLVAVKKLSLDTSQQGEPEFLVEVRMITSIQHKNLVRLLGCCSYAPQRLLV